MNPQSAVDHPILPNIDTAQKSKKRQFLFHSLTIEQRLPLFICVLLTLIVLVFSCLSYLGVKNAAMASGKERATTLADKLSDMFKGSVDKFEAATNALAIEPAVKTYLASNRRNNSSQVDSLFRDFLKKDTTNKAIELINEKKQFVMIVGDKNLPKIPGILTLAGKNNNSGVGRIIYQHGEMYFPVMSSVLEHEHLIGYVVNWKHLHATQQYIDQFGQLLGSNGKLYFGNDDGRFWTNLLRPVSPPPLRLSQLQKVVNYSRNNGEPVLGVVRKIADSRWIFLVELSESSFQQTANSFLKLVIIIGLLLIVAGSLAAWVMSKSITKPIKHLGNAASAMAEGNYSMLVHIKRNDELGALAESFNIMAVRVREAQEHLEQKVEHTSQELLTAITSVEYQREMERRKDEFISIASHELKTPLTTVKAFFQLTVKEIPPDSRPAQLIGKAARQLMRMERLVGDLLDVSKINAGKMQYHFEVFDFQEVLTEAIASVQEINVSHRLVLESTVSVPFTGDRNRIEQVLVNVLTNAVKYSPEKDHVLIRSELKANQIIVYIQDFGIGIEEKYFGELFDRFNRIDPDHRFQGLGLGLFISHEIIKRHGGSIQVSSEIGKGSIFTIAFPVQGKENLYA